MYASETELNFPEQLETLSSNTSSSNGFNKNSTAPALNACIRIFRVAMCCNENRRNFAALGIQLRLQLKDQTSPACGCQRSGMLSYIAGLNPGILPPMKTLAQIYYDFSRPCSALRIDSSSSRIAINFILPSLSMAVIYSIAQSSAIMLWYRGANTARKAMEQGHQARFCQVRVQASRPF